MKTRLFLVTTLVLLLGMAAAIYFLIDFSRQNEEISNNLEQVTEQLNDTKVHLDTSEQKVESLTDEVGQLSTEANNFRSSLEELQLTYDELYSFTYCGDELLDLEMTYRSNAKASEALTQWVDEMWGDVIDSYWWDFWTPDGPGLHVVETGYANDYFIVYFEQQDFFDAPSGVFIVSHHCWLDVELEN